MTLSVAVCRWQSLQELGFILTLSELVFSRACCYKNQDYLVLLIPSAFLYHVMTQAGALASPTIVSQINLYLIKDPASVAFVFQQETDYQRQTNSSLLTIVFRRGGRQGQALCYYLPTLGGKSHVSRAPPQTYKA